MARSRRFDDDENDRPRKQGGDGRTFWVAVAVVLGVLAAPSLLWAVLKTVSVFFYDLPRDNPDADGEYGLTPLRLAVLFALWLVAAALTGCCLLSVVLARRAGRRRG